MMNGNDAAYPSHHFPERWNPEFGLSKRELFAAMAMQGLLFDPVDLRMIAQLSVKAADALIAELSKAVQDD
jgi:hypothetical protein